MANKFLSSLEENNWQRTVHNEIPDTLIGSEPVGVNDMLEKEEFPKYGRFSLYGKPSWIASRVCRAGLSTDGTESDCCQM